MTDVFKEYENLPQKLIKEAKENMTGSVSASKAKSVLKQLSEEYERMKVSPGESVGLVAAESIGEPGTQMT